MNHKRILSRHRLRRNDRLPSRCQTPSPRPERPIQNAPIFDLRQIQYAVRLDLDILRVYGCEQRVSRLLGKGVRRQPVVGARPVHLLGLFVKERRRVVEAASQVRSAVVSGDGSLIGESALAYGSFE